MNVNEQGFVQDQHGSRRATRWRPMRDCGVPVVKPEPRTHSTHDEPQTTPVLLFVWTGVDTGGSCHNTCRSISVGYTFPTLLTMKKR